MNPISLLVKVLKPTVAPGVYVQSSWAILRLIVGVIMVHNGMDKLSDIESFAESYVAFLGLPFPIFLSYIAAYTELLGAPLVALGIFTRPAALGLFSTMMVACYHHYIVAGFNIPYLELSSLYAGVFLFFAVNGGGLFSFDALFTNIIDKTALSGREKVVMRLERALQAEDAAEEAATS
ncbi:MAG: DoxX family protein [Cyanobacteria bacterium P01_F01_bin.153]